MDVNIAYRLTDIFTITKNKFNPYDLINKQKNEKRTYTYSLIMITLISIEISPLMHTYSLPNLLHF